MVDRALHNIRYTSGLVHLGYGMGASRNHAYHTFSCWQLHGSYQQDRTKCQWLSSLIFSTLPYMNTQISQHLPLPLNAFSKSRQGGPRYKLRLPTGVLYVLWNSRTRRFKNNCAWRGTLLWSIMQLGRWPPAFCGTHSANCMRQHTVLTPGELLTYFPAVKHSDGQFHTYRVL